MGYRVHEEKCDYCGKLEHFAKGLCHNCYERMRRNGTPDFHQNQTKEERQQKAQEYYVKNKEKILENCKKRWIEYYKKNKQKESERKRQWYIKKKIKRIINETNKILEEE